MKKFLVIVLFLPLAVCSQSGNDLLIRDGNEFYKKQEYPKAANQYQKALQSDPKDLKASFNLANTYYRQDQKVEAAKLFSGLLPDVKEHDLKNRIYYNKGVILSDQKNLEESIEAYKNALRQDPSDREARENLQKALLELKRKPPPQPKEEKKDKKKQQQQQQKQPQSKLNQKETEQRLKLLQQKEKQVQERIQKEKNKGIGGSNNKDW
ncbi:MAG: tetratricopeptide repeat protein [Chitinophagaceae bacterium]|nr:tetratricopeptide repeat protein [Chitinophagaceae bacterium]